MRKIGATAMAKNCEEKDASIVARQCQLNTTKQSKTSSRQMSNVNPEQTIII